MILLLPGLMFGQLSIPYRAEIDSLLAQNNYREVITIYKSQVNVNALNSPKDLSTLGHCYESINKEDSAFYFYKKALEGYKRSNNLKGAAKINLEIFSLLNSQKKVNINSQLYFDEFYNYAINSNSKEMLARAYNTLGLQQFSNEDPAIPLKQFNKSATIYKELDSIQNVIDLYSNIAVLYTVRQKKFDSARYYLNRGFHLAKENNLEMKGDNLFYLNVNYGNSYKTEFKLDSAIRYFKRAEKQVPKKYTLNNLKLIYENLEYSYNEKDEHEIAYYYLKKIDSLKDLIGVTNQNTLISEIEEKYENQKLKTDNLELDLKRTTNRNLLYGSLGILLLGSIIFYLTQKNTKRKQRIAEQEREIEIQKTEKILKEQELNTIDAMLAGQEKERQKLAEDLHDSVGATLAAAKLQFNHLSQHRDNLKEMDELFSKTGVLLDDAYIEIRSMAHLKNSGVIAKNGLIPALQKLAKNASSANGLQVTVENFGLEQRLDNSQEITIFRIIQELITNIIKHADATEASVSLTPHENELSIIIEDNGKGFIPRTIVDKSGMGLANIERRVEHIEGTMEIDSTPGNGTTILIDIPL